MLIFRSRFTLILFGIIFSCSFHTATAEQPAAPPETFQETMTSLGRCISGEEFFPHSITISPDLKHLAYVSRIDKFFRVWHDGEAEKTYPGITRDSPFFSPGKNRLAFVVLEDGEMYAVIDNKARKRYASVGTITFSPDGSRYAYRAENTEGEQFVVVDGEKGPIFPAGVPHTIGIVFSPDSTRMAYVGIERDGSHTLVLNQKKSSNHDEISDIRFSPDSSYHVIICRDKEEWMVVRDGKRGRRYQSVANLVFSPDSRHIAYTARKREKMIVVKNNREHDRGQGAVTPMFSPDGNRFAYLTIDAEGHARYIIDNERGPVIGRPGKLRFSSDSTRVAYGAWIGGQWHIIADGEKGPAFEEILFFFFSLHTNDLIYGARDKEGKSRIVVNNQLGKAYEAVGMAVPSPDKEGGLAYAATAGEETFIVVNGQEKEPYPIIGIPREDHDKGWVFSYQHPFFNQDGSRMAYPVFLPEENQGFMVVDGKAQQKFDRIGRPYFSPDGKHVVYTAVKDREILIVVDGYPGQARFDGVIRGADIRFEADNRFYLLVARQTDPGPSFFRLEVEIDERPES